jgi:serine/threonine protein kinase
MTMTAPSSIDQFVDLVRRAKIVEDDRLNAFMEKTDLEGKSPSDLADRLVDEALLTSYQAVQLLQGKATTFSIGPYRILERLGFGATSNVYLCEHRYTHNRVAVKVLPALKAKDPVALKRFYREARASAFLEHPNVVRVQDVDHAGDDHFMVMDFVDGTSVLDIVQHFGVMDVSRAAHYIKQAADGLHYANQAKLVHRDINPGNILVDREGTVKILDMGLARIAADDLDVLTRGVVLGLPEYMAPEQAVDSHGVDIRADIYSLGATFYFLLAGEPPYSEEKTLAQKLLAKASRPPQSIRERRPEVSEELEAVIIKMMAKDADKRYQTPREVAEALEPWTKAAIPPPADKEMPQLSPAAMGKEPKPAAPAAKKRPAATMAAIDVPPAQRPAPRRLVDAAEDSAGPSLNRAAPTLIRQPVEEEPSAEEEAAAEPEQEAPKKKKKKKKKVESSVSPAWSVSQVVIYLLFGAAAFALAWLYFMRK